MEEPTALTVEVLLAMIGVGEDALLTTLDVRCKQRGERGYGTCLLKRLIMILIMMVMPVQVLSLTACCYCSSYFVDIVVIEGDILL